MPFREGAFYLAPDGRRFRAQLDSKQYRPPPHRSWTLIPVRPDNQENANSGSWRDKLSQMLFLEEGRLIAFDFNCAKIVNDTGWTAADLQPEA